MLKLFSTRTNRLPAAKAYSIVFSSLNTLPLTASSKTNCRQSSLSTVIEYSVSETNQLRPIVELSVLSLSRSSSWFGFLRDFPAVCDSFHSSFEFMDSLNDDQLLKTSTEKDKM